MIKGKILLFIAVVLLAGCATGSALVTGVKRDPVDPSNVQIYRSRPDVKFEHIGIVKSEAEEIFSQQLTVKANPDDLLIVLSGSGNSQNVINALEVGNEIGMKTFAILGFSGGKCKHLAQHSIHFEIDDMQISEDLQLIVGHICMRWLYENGKGE